MVWHVLLAVALIWPWPRSTAPVIDADLVRVQVRDRASLWIDKPAADPILVKLSESLTIVVRVEGQSAVDVSLSEEMPVSTAWHVQVLGKPVVMKFDDGKFTRWEQRYLATPLQPGLYPLKLPALSYSEKNSPERKVEWEPLSLRITTRVAKADVSEARDRTSIEELPPAPAESESAWWPWLLVAIPIVGIAFFLARRRRQQPIIASSSHDSAAQELMELGQMECSSERIKEFYTSLSAILRRFLERRLQLPVTSRTTEEFFASLTKDSPLDEHQRKLLDEILKECDMAKFAPATPATSNNKRALELANEFVTLAGTKPQGTVGGVNGQLLPNVPLPPPAGTR